MFTQVVFTMAMGWNGYETNESVWIFASAPSPEFTALAEACDSMYFAGLIHKSGSSASHPYNINIT